jgi:hypothetical protein
MAVAHLALDLGAGDERCDGIHDQDVDGVRAHQSVDDLERLLARIGLRDDEVVDVDSELLGINGIERMLGIDEGGGAAILLRLGNGMERERGLARAFRPVDLDTRPRGGRRRRARCRARASRWKWFRSAPLRANPASSR